MAYLLEYIGIVSTGLLFLLVYKKYKNGSLLNKEKSEEIQTNEKKQSWFDKWWMQSELREIYVVRASQRKLACFIPWVGVVISGFFVLFWSIGTYMAVLNPPQPFEKLTKYEGIITGYAFRKKSDNLMVVKLTNGEVINFHSYLLSKEKMDESIKLKQKVTVWAQTDFGLTDFGHYETAQWIEIDHKPTSSVYKTFQERFKRDSTHLYESVLPDLFYSLFWLFFFLLIIYFINAFPVQDKNNSHKDITHGDNQ